MARYTVLEVSNEICDWMAQGKFPMKEYRVNLQPPDGVTPIVNVEWSRKAESPAPTPGQIIEVDRLEDRGPRGLKLHLANPQGGDGGYKADPHKQAAIAMESAQKSAVEIARLALEYKLPSEEVLLVVRNIASHLYEQIAEASK